MVAVHFAVASVWHLPVAGSADWTWDVEVVAAAAGVAAVVAVAVGMAAGSGSSGKNGVTGEGHSAVDTREVVVGMDSVVVAPVIVAALSSWSAVANSTSLSGHRL